MDGIVYATAFVSYAVAPLNVPTPADNVLLIVVVPVDPPPLLTFLVLIRAVFALFSC